MKKHMTTIILILVFLLGLSLLLYPTVSDWWNSFHQTRAINGYNEAVEQMSAEDIAALRSEAVAYNASLVGAADAFASSEEGHSRYEDLLNVSGDGIMGYIEIPTIDCKLPIYHGVEEGTLAVGVGHIEGSSLPVGGESTHTVLSGHRGLPSARLFTDLDQMKEGDTFSLHILNETLTYQVDQILIVEPEDISALLIQSGRDLCTLVTCTPYGVNSHRLLVRGTRIANPDEGALAIAADAELYDPLTIAPLAAIPLLLLLFILLLTKRPGRKRKKEKEAKQ